MNPNFLDALLSQASHQFSQSILASYINFSNLGWVLFFFTLLTYLISKEQWLRLRREMQSYVMIDTLTGLPNRTLFEDRGDKALNLAHRKKEKVAIVLGNLDSFKAINDKLGHKAGDEMLKEVGQRLNRMIRGEDTLSRLSGDDFGFIIQNVQSEQDLVLVANRILTAINEPYLLNGEPHHVSISLGIAISGDTAESREDLQKRADIALYQSKGARNVYTFYRDQSNPVPLEAVS